MILFLSRLEVNFSKPEVLFKMPSAGKFNNFSLSACLHVWQTTYIQGMEWNKTVLRNMLFLKNEKN